jgi:SAM-dependent methyltransferase
MAWEAASKERLQGFDAAAGAYGAEWDERPLVRELRARVIAEVAVRLAGGGTILDLGCGVGTDARILAAVGYAVVAVDASPFMVAAARATGVDARRADLSDPIGLRAALGDCRAAGALSDFGALNCVSTLRPLGSVLADVLQPGGWFVAVVMGRRCVAEDLALLARGRRPRRRDGPVHVHGASVPVRFLDPRTVAEELGPAFRVRVVRALGLLVPPPDLGGAPGLRARLEPAFAGWPVLRELGDHTLIVLERA